MFTYERSAQKNGFKLIIGVDEAGRGPLAGPVVAAAVCLATSVFKERIDDSKKLTSLQRRRAFEEIKIKSSYGVGIIYEDVIDGTNIVQAAHQAADMAIQRLLSQLQIWHPSFHNTFLLFDGSLSSALGYPSKEIIGGDAKSFSIAAASIVAKVFRDQMMDFYDGLYPRYGFKSHKGYGTKKHLENIFRFGLCPIHRRSFCHRDIKNQCLKST